MCQINSIEDLVEEINGSEFVYIYERNGEWIWEVKGVDKSADVSLDELSTPEAAILDLILFLLSKVIRE